MMKLFYFPVLFISFLSQAQMKLNWQNADEQFQPLPSSVHVYFTESKIDTAPFRAYYLIADLTDKNLEFTTDTTYKRRMTPMQFFQKNNQPLVVVNTTFFSFETNQNLNVVIKEGRLISYNIHTIAGRGKDTFTFRHPIGSALGINKNRKADIAWIYTDSSKKYPYATQYKFDLRKDSFSFSDFQTVVRKSFISTDIHSQKFVKAFKKWKMKTAIGGGPVLVQYGNVNVTNNAEWRFPGKAINDKHPRTAMGYTKDQKLIIIVVEGRNPAAGGASLNQLAEIMKDLGCVEALNLDGGGSSCLLINGKETIKPSDKNQRSVPAVFIIKKKRS